jgi:hypothetical protein
MPHADLRRRIYIISEKPGVLSQNEKEACVHDRID